MGGDDFKARPEVILGHQSLLRIMPLHSVKPSLQMKTIEEILFGMLVNYNKMINLK
jgi:hypothetical protein